MATPRTNPAGPIDSNGPVVHYRAVAAWETAPLRSGCSLGRAFERSEEFVERSHWRPHRFNRQPRGAHRTRTELTLWGIVAADFDRIAGGKLLSIRVRLNGRPNDCAPSEVTLIVRELLDERHLCRRCVGSFPGSIAGRPVVVRLQVDAIRREDDQRWRTVRVLGIDEQPGTNKGMIGHLRVLGGKCPTANNQGPEQRDEREQHDDEMTHGIEATDRQIDRLVYELYGLTDDETAIVEAG